MADNYIFPLGIDTKNFQTGLGQMDAGLENLTINAQGAGKAISEVLNTTARSGDALVLKINQGATAAKNFQDAANRAGADLEKAFDAKKVNTTEITEKVNAFVVKMKDVIGKPISFKFDIDKAGADLLTQKLKGLTDQMQGFQIVVDTANAKLKTLAAGSPAFVALSKQIKEADDFLNVLKMDLAETGGTQGQTGGAQAFVDLGNAAAGAEPKIESLRAQIRQGKQDLSLLTEGTAEFIAKSKEVGELQDRFGDLSQRVKALASDTQKLDAGISAIRGLAGAFASAQGAIALFGEQNEEVAATIQKVQGALALLQGVQEVANVLNKDSALSVYLQSYASKARTEALVVETAAIATETVATEGATVATEAWTVALLANPITAIIAVLAIAVAALYEFSKAQKQGGLSADQFNKSLEIQNKLLQQDYDRVEASVKIRTAALTAEKKNQSDLLEVQVNALRQKQIYDQIEIDESLRLRGQLDHDDKEYQKTYAEATNKINDLIQQRINRGSEISALEISQRQQVADERNKLYADEVKEAQANYDAIVSIQNQAKDYAFQILSAKISDLKDGQQKELATLKVGLDQNLNAIDQKQKADLLALQNKKINLNAEFALADENGKKLLAQQLGDAEKQIQAQIKLGDKSKEYAVTLTTSYNEAVKKVNEKYNNERADFEFETANILLSLQKETENKKVAILQLSAQHELDVLERSNIDAQEKNERRLAIELKLAHDIADVKLQSSLDEIQKDRQINANKINALQQFAAQNEQVQAMKNILLLKNDADAAELTLQKLKDAGKDQRDQAVINATAQVNATRDALNKAIAAKPPQTLASIFFPDATTQQQQFITSQVTSTFNSLSKAVDDYTSLVIDRYQKIVDAKKAAVQADDDAIDKLQDQLKTEQDLRSKGYASNIAGVNAQLAAATAQRAKDIADQEEYQKKLEKSQKAQADAQTALQAANLITASTNIYLQASALGPAGVAVASIAIAAMIAAFAVSRFKAYEAINESSKFAEGGEITGRSHAQGGQKYYSPDAGAGVMELEDGEFVVKKTATEKYKPLLEAVNNHTFGSMSDVQIRELLSGLGVHLDMEGEHKEALHEARVYTTNTISASIPERHTPQELRSIDNNLRRMMQQQENKPIQYEEGDFIVTKKGNTTTKIRKTK